MKTIFISSFILLTHSLSGQLINKITQFVMDYDNRKFKFQIDDKGVEHDSDNLFLIEGVPQYKRGTKSFVYLKNRGDINIKSSALWGISDIIYDFIEEGDVYVSRKKRLITFVIYDTFHGTTYGEIYLPWKPSELTKIILIEDPSKYQDIEWDALDSPEDLDYDTLALVSYSELPNSISLENVVFDFIRNPSFEGMPLVGGSSKDSFDVYGWNDCAEFKNHTAPDIHSAETDHFGVLSAISI